jgi:hypothetical protein
MFKEANARDALILTKTRWRRWLSPVRFAEI